MAVQKLANGWRARRKKDGKTFNGPLRATEVAANEDARQMEEAAAVSSERLKEVFDRLSGSLSASAVTSVPAVTQNGSNWRARVKVSRATINGPTRQSKAAAEEDARLFQQAQQISFVSSHLMIDSVWEDMNDDGHRFFCWLPDPLLTQCGKTGAATDKSKLFVTCVEFAPVREEVLQVLSGF